MRIHCRTLDVNCMRPTLANELVNLVELCKQPVRKAATAQGRTRTALLQQTLCLEHTMSNTLGQDARPGLALLGWFATCVLGKSPLAESAKSGKCSKYVFNAFSFSNRTWHKACAGAKENWISSVQAFKCITCHAQFCIRQKRHTEGVRFHSENHDVNCKLLS